MYVCAFLYSQEANQLPSQSLKLWPRCCAAWCSFPSLSSPPLPILEVKLGLSCAWSSFWAAPQLPPCHYFVLFLWLIIFFLLCFSNYSIKWGPPSGWLGHPLLCDRRTLFTTFMSLWGSVWGIVISNNSFWVASSLSSGILFSSPLGLLHFGVLRVCLSPNHFDSVA